MKTGMDIISLTRWLLTQEAKALLTRLERIKPLVLHETMVPAANVSPVALTAIERHLSEGRRKLKSMVQVFIEWLNNQEQRFMPQEAQRRFSLLKLRFNSILTQFDIFSDVMTQRSEYETGIWLSGLDVVAQDALALPGYFESPPVVCYLDRGVGAAIRRARTRLPGGGKNPVAVIRIPRERMVGSGIASSLVHEVGHQVSALLDLVNSIRPLLRGMQKGRDFNVWELFERWISEILADLWAVGRVGVAATTGLMGVVSLPRAFVFRISLDDPHPFPYIRVKLSCAMGRALYPHPQWERLSRLWEAFYPVDELGHERRQLINMLEESIPAFVTLLVNHRPRALQGASLKEVMDLEMRKPSSLVAYYSKWQDSPGLIKRVPPTLAFAIIGQARAEGLMSPEIEAETISRLLQDWALHSTINISAICAESQRVKQAVPVI